VKNLILAEQAKADLDRLDRATCLRVTAAIHRMVDTGAGNIKKLQGINPPEYRLRVGDFRVRFSQPTVKPSASTASRIAARPTAEVDGPAA
jgi:mRNA-degrading endonuclease RelE of RelBE toxin-antitoxin system